MALIEHSFNLSGTVRHQGLSLAQVQVLLYDLYPGNVETTSPVAIGDTKTGSRGEFSFSVKSGVYRLEIVPDGKTRFLAQSLAEVKVITNTSLNIALSTGCIVDGQLATGLGFEGNRSQLFSGCEVTAVGIEPTSYRAQSTVDENGAFSLIIPRGKYYFVVRSNDFISTECSMVNISADTDITLGLPSFVRFEGAVVDEKYQPVGGGTVVITPSPASASLNPIVSELNVQTTIAVGEDGQFVTALEEGPYDIAVEPAAGSSHFAFFESEVEVAGSPGARFLRRFVMQEGHRLSGIVFADDKPLSQALVRVQPEIKSAVPGEKRSEARSGDKSTGKNEYIALTNGDGEFALSIPTGDYRLVAAAHPKDAPSITIEGGEYSSLAPWHSRVSVLGDVEMMISLTEGSALLGRICDDAQQARPGVRVQIFSDSTAPVASSPVLATGITDGEGRFGVFLSPGEYWLVIHRDFANAKSVQIENEPVSLDITWHGWSQLAFEVVGESGQPVPRCQVFYHPYGQESDEKPPRASSAMPLPYGYVVTSDEGICKLTLPAGIYTFKFVPPTVGSFGPKTIRQLSISADISRRVTLDAKSTEAAAASSS